MPETQGSVRKPRLAVKLAVVACAVVVGLLIFEVFLRAVGYTYPVFYEPDDVRGWALRPGMEGWYRKEGEAYVRVNSRGLRDREHAREKPPGTLRVALLGDSYAEALQVEQEKAFWSVAERRLRGCAPLAGRGVEFVNFGVSGYGTAQELLTLREKVWDYRPDVVLLAVTTNNDVLDNVRALKGTDEIPYFVRGAGGALVLDDSFRTTPAFRWRQSALSRLGRWLRDSLRFVQAVHEAHGALKAALAARRERAAAAAAKEKQAADGNHNTQAADADAAQAQANATGDELGAANEVYREPSGEAWKEAWALTEELVLKMRGEVEERGARFVVVTVSNGIQVHPDARARAAFARRVGAEDLFYPERRFKTLGERKGFPVLNLAPDLQIYAERNKVFLHGFGPQLGNGHWNEEGHRAAGELLSQNLCELLARP